jgi:ubiquinone/menaquinone biosynthesis C-methylase UbiE
MKLLIAFCVTVLILSFHTNCSSNQDRQKHFNELAASEEWQPDKVIEVLKIQKGWHIGDLGAGGGYYTYRFAEETGPKGKVFAADINQEFLEGIEKSAKEKGFQNVYTILSSPEDSKFEDNSLDLIFIRNTFHHFDNKNIYMRKLSSKLKANGQIALIDYKEDSSIWHFGHNVSREEILLSIQDTGLVIENEFDFLEKQYFFILKRQ